MATIKALSAGLIAIAGFSFVSLSHTAVTNAQSFSCANAQIPSEMAICNNESLLVKDERLASLFANAIIQASAGGDITTISAEHSLWLKRRNDCRVDFECLEKRYEERINSLSGEAL